MKHFFLAPALLLAVCQSNPTAPATPDGTQQTPAQTAANQEHIELSMLTINGQPHAPLSTQLLTSQLLTSQLGRPDSIAKGAVECGGELEPVNNANGDRWYYGKTAYEVGGPQAVLASFDVTTGKFQGKLSKLILNQNTTLEDVRRFFPVSAKQADIPATGRPGEVMSLPFYQNGTLLDASLNLIFQHGRLQEVEFFDPC